MRFIADFHIHSHYSRATTKQLNPENLDYWSRVKGLNVIGTGDCVHPGWLDELRENLEPAPNGLYQLKPDYRLAVVSSSRLSEQPLNFLLTAEISSIYKKNGKVRKVHNICVLPDFEAAARFQARLAAIGNIASDGRPILGLDARNLLEILLESSDQAYLIPAHIWTPWFSVLGSQSGFDSIEECFDDLTPHIFAVETGLSSDPAMNRVCSMLDRFRLVSNSDAHSPEKLGREANLFDTQMSYRGILDSLKQDQGFLGTIEFFPHEGKYHYDGHRNCGVRWDPLKTLKHHGICTGCGKPVTRGVMYRVAELADRPLTEASLGKQRYYSITPLAELIAETLGRKGSASQSVRREYKRLTEALGSEFHILLFAELDEIKKVGGEILAEGIRRLRLAEVLTEPGYDGEFGKVRVFRPGEMNSLPQGSLFSMEPASRAGGGMPASVEFDVAEFQRRLKEKSASRAEKGTGPLSETDVAAAASIGQDTAQQAITFGEGVCLIIAGPGSGKTRTLVERIGYLVRSKHVPPAKILAITFSNKAAEEIRARLESHSERSAGVTVTTFHAFGLSVLRAQAKALGLAADFGIVDDEERRALLAAAANVDKRRVSALMRELSAFKQGWLSEPSPDLAAAYDAYEQALRRKQLVDLDDLLWQPVRILKQDADLLKRYRERFRWLLVDEYQDINARQYELIRLLCSGRRPNLFAIGDPNQAIYGFRGSDVRLIDKLKVDFPALRAFTLAKSYRVPSAILRGAGQVLQTPEALTGTLGDVKMHVQRCPTDRSEADWIAAQIEQMIGGVGSYSLHTGVSQGTEAEGIASFRDFAVLCRTSAMFGLLSEALAQHGIAYQQIGIEPFYRAEPWAAAIGLVRAALRPDSASDEPKLADIARDIDRRIPVAELLCGLIAPQTVADFDRQRLERFAAPFGSRYGEFLQAVTLRQGVDDYDSRAERVSLMTMHASKGLEFPVVFIPGCEEGLIPFEQFGKKSAEELAEEERLLYVAMTRTKRYLFLTHAQKRLRNGRMTDANRSPLLDRVAQELLETAAREGKPVPAETQLSIWA